MNILLRKVLPSLLILLSAGVDIHAQNGQVSMWEGSISLPTYKVNPPEKAPLFERDFAYQRAKRSVYPYPMNDNPTNVKTDSVYHALFLENDYIKVCVLPDIGGRLFYATDKTDGYEIFYRQHVIKPANVGMLGAWISGGVEWNVFHHHRATSQSPVDYKLVDNGDGSKTIWVGEVERRQRMSWAVGMTLYPDKSYIQITGRFFNDTFDRNSMLHWNNVATHANENYQIVFPENTDFGTFHHKNSFLRWPVPDAPYCGNPDYVGKDVSYWKNLPALTGGSVFAYDLKDDFIGGYDYGKNAGTMLASNHNICKGGKFWTWGNMNYGHQWDCVTLTDSDGPYVELMTSAYSDNQPDYCWINPYETKEFTAYWYGIRDLHHVNRGNRNATVNMDISPDGKIHLAANVTEVRNDARIAVMHDGKTLFETKADITPFRPFSADIKTTAGEVAEPSEVTMFLFDRDGKELISYHPYKRDADRPLPTPLEPLDPDPKSISNTEEVYYLGMRNLQFHNAHVNPNDYFFEVVRRDSGDVRANTQLGIYYREQGAFDKAEKYLRTALKRQTANYTRPSDAEAMYNLGLVLKAEGRFNDAVDTLYRAAWDYEFASAAYYQLAEISSIMGDGGQAAEEARKAIDYNGMNQNAKNLLTTIERRAGKTDEAVGLALEVSASDPLNHYAAYELLKLGKVSEESFSKLLRNDNESYLELAVDYLDNGFVEESGDILARSEAISEYPTVEYYQGFLADAGGNKAAAKALFRNAESRSIDYVFPFRLETVKVYEKALEYLPQSANTWYYLGDLYFQRQPEKAMECWKRAVDLKPDFAMALRNLGWGCRFATGDFDAGIGWYEKAIKADKDSNAIFLAECDEMMEHANYPLEKRYALFAGREKLYEKRYDSETKAIRQRILHGEYEDVLNPLLTHYYSRREHIEDLHDIYVDACILSGFKAWSRGDAKKALEYMLMSNEYPENQGYVHLEYYARDAQVYYNIGLAYEKAGDRRNARKYFEMASKVEVRDKDCIYNYEKALAMKRMNPKADVTGMFEAMVASGKASVTDHVERFFESFDYGEYPQDVNSRAYYMQGLGYRALGNDAEAKECFGKALSQRNDNVWANYYLGNIK
jgi:tetratricopeptide (TPR) repeat protein